MFIVGNFLPVGPAMPMPRAKAPRSSLALLARVLLPPASVLDARELPADFAGVLFGIGEQRRAFAG